VIVAAADAARRGRYAAGDEEALMTRWTRWIAAITAIALTIAAFATTANAAPGDRDASRTSDSSLARDFNRSTNGAATDFRDAVRALEHQVGLQPGNGTITAAEIGAANYQALVREIAAIGDTFDPLTVPSASNDAKLGTWALGLYAQRYDDNPNAIPIATPITLLFIAVALLFIPALFAATGGTSYGLDGVPAIHDIVPLLAPALQSFVRDGAHKKDGPLVSAADQQGIHDAVTSSGVSGNAVDLVTQILTLAASLVIADARR
jgi:hypothetical protein